MYANTDIMTDLIDRLYRYLPMDALLEISSLLRDLESSLGISVNPALEFTEAE